MIRLRVPTTSARNAPFFPLIFLFLASLAAATTPASAFSAAEEAPVGQVVRADSAKIEGASVGFLLSADRAVQTSPEERPLAKSELIMAPSANPSSWQRFSMPGTATLLALGDVDGDGNDDVAIGNPSLGASCPSAVVQATPCGVIYVFDGPSLRHEDPLLIARIVISPTPGSCNPSTYTPSSLALRDLDGDGRAELAFGQLGVITETCGVVHAFRGTSLQGDVTMASACASYRGPVQASNRQPDNFGLTLEFLRGGPSSTALLAVAAPYADVGGFQAAGRVSLFKLPTSCITGSDQPAPGVVASVFEYTGDDDAHLAGMDMAQAEDTLLISSQGRVDALRRDSFELAHRHRPPEPFPLGIPGDLNGDGRTELLFGPWVVEQTGAILMYLGPFAVETFRGTFVDQDEVVSSDKFGLRVWGISDVWSPRLAFSASPGSVRAGEIVNVSVAEKISLVPTTDPLRFVVSGGQIIEQTESWVLVKAGSGPEVVVHGSLLDVTRIVRVPVQATNNHVEIQGPTAVRIGEPFDAVVYAPSASNVQWSVQGGTPASGSGHAISTTFGSAGTFIVAAVVQLQDGTQRSVSHTVSGLAPPSIPLQVSGPAEATQGSLIEVTVTNPEGGSQYLWEVRGTDGATTTASGTAITFPASVMGRLRFTVVETTNGEKTRVAEHGVDVVNLVPVIRSLQTKTVGGLEATVDAHDPGGDDFEISWDFDGERVASGPSIRLNAPPGIHMLKVLVTDEFGGFTEQSREVNITTGWTVTPVAPNQAGDSGDEEDASTDASTTADPSYEWKVDRIKGKADTRKGAGIPSAGSAPVLLMIVIACIWANRRAR